MNMDVVYHQREKLFSHAPELRDEARRAEFARQIVRAGRECGFTEQDVMGVWDYRVLLLFRYAMCHLRLWQED